jgi:hypothetical protein
VVENAVFPEDRIRAPRSTPAGAQSNLGSTFMPNECVFSGDRRHRYTLIHRWDDLLTPSAGDGIAWICLNPSTADEQQLDPTLRRIQGFSEAWGYTHFVMLNLFAWRATDPADMKAAADPVGPDNDAAIVRAAGEAAIVVCAWGNHGAHLERSSAVTEILRKKKIKLHALRVNAGGEPAHPLYLPGNLRPMPWR